MLTMQSCCKRKSWRQLELSFHSLLLFVKLLWHDQRFCPNEGDLINSPNPQFHPVHPMFICIALYTTHRGQWERAAALWMMSSWWWWRQVLVFLLQWRRGSRRFPRIRSACPAESCRSCVRPQETPSLRCSGTKRARKWIHRGSRWETHSSKANRSRVNQPVMTSMNKWRALFQNAINAKF